MADLPVVSQDLSDLADVVLTKLRESDGANECPIVIVYAKRGFHPIPNTASKCYAYAKRYAECHADDIAFSNYICYSVCHANYISYAKHFT